MRSQIRHEIKSNNAWATTMTLSFVRPYCDSKKQGTTAYSKLDPSKIL